MTLSCPVCSLDCDRQSLQVILLTDADVDGAHIRTLLLTFLFRYCRALFEEGHVYVGVPPLYKLEVGKKAQYCYDDQELQSMTSGLASGSYTIQRFKVLLSIPLRHHVFQGLHVKHSMICSS